MLLTWSFCLFLQQSDLLDRLSGAHNWYMYSCSHAKPAFCNVCREMLSGTSKGLSCEGMNNDISRVYLMFWGKHCWQVCFWMPLLNKLTVCFSMSLVNCISKREILYAMCVVVTFIANIKTTSKHLKPTVLADFTIFQKFQNYPKEHVHLKALQNYLGCYHYKNQIVSGKSWSTKSYQSSPMISVCLKSLLVLAYSTTILPA